MNSRTVYYLCCRRCDKTQLEGVDDRKLEAQAKAEGWNVNRSLCPACLKVMAEEITNSPPPLTPAPTVYLLWRGCFDADLVGVFDCWSDLQSTLLETLTNGEEHYVEVWPVDGSREPKRALSTAV